MYTKGDIVMYGTQGVCKITGITEKKFAGERHEYYELKPVYDEKSVLFVPVKNEALVEKMHRVLSAEAVDELIQAMPEEGAVWIEDEKERKKRYKEVLEQGDRKALVRTIKSLYTYRQKLKAAGKKIHVCDENFLKEAERVLYDEFAYVLRIDREKILEYIVNQVEELELEQQV